MPKPRPRVRQIPRLEIRYFLVRKKLAREQLISHRPIATMSDSSFLAIEKVNSLRSVSWKIELTKPKMTNIIIGRRQGLKVNDEEPLVDSL
jgi:hypothetical protein